MIEVLKDFDAFSESIQFNASKKRLKIRTLLGAFLSAAILIIALSYFIYLTFLYFDGKIEPKFQSQNFVSNDDIQVQLTNELIGFDFFSYNGYNYLNQIQDEQNKTYIVYQGMFRYSNSTDSFVITLDIIRCKSPQLKNMNCFDFSKVPNQVLTLGNINRILSSINLYVYRCQDTDQLKTFVPNDCAQEQQINELINHSDYFLNIKIKTSQFNTTQQEIQDQYRSQLTMCSTSVAQVLDFRIQNQITSVKKGFFIQSEQTYTSPISYSTQSLTYNRQWLIQDIGTSYLSYVYFEIDENITYFRIQYPMFTEVLALCNSTLALMIMLCSFCRSFTQKIIRKDIFFTLLQNMFTKTYINMLKNCNIQQQNEEIQEKDMAQGSQIQKIQSANQEGEEVDKTQSEEKMETESKNDISIPQFQSKFSQQLTHDLVSQKIGPHIKENKEDIVKLSNIYKQSNREEVEFKKYDNLHDLTCQQSLNFQNSSFQDQSPNLINSYQKNSQFHSLEFKDKLSQINSSIFKQNKMKQKMFQHHKSSQNQIKNQKLQSLNKKVDESLQMLNEKQLSLQLEDQLFSTKIFKRKSQLENKGVKKQMLKKIEQQIDDSLDFFKFFKEILFLKKAALILLSKEQLAAIQLVGLDINDIQSKSEGDCMNHLKEQYEILQSTELQSQYIKIFLQKCQNKYLKDPIDKRILSSLAINDQH